MGPFRCYGTVNVFWKYIVANQILLTHLVTIVVTNFSRVKILTGIRAMVELT